MDIRPFGSAEQGASNALAGNGTTPPIVALRVERMRDGGFIVTSAPRSADFAPNVIHGPLYAATSIENALAYVKDVLAPEEWVGKPAVGKPGCLPASADLKIDWDMVKGARVSECPCDECVQARAAIEPKGYCTTAGEAACLDVPPSSRCFSCPARVR